jgi:hypothetical protein
MRFRERLDYWRSERDRLQARLEADPRDRRKLANLLRCELERAEVFILVYEDAAAHGEEEAPRPASRSIN